MISVALAAYKGEKYIYEQIKSILPQLAEKDEIIYKSARNIAGVKVSPVNAINVYDLLNADKVVIAKAAVEKLEEVYA